MFKEIKDILFSNKLMAVLLLIFASAIGVATFLENDFGTMASKDIVYNAFWFELLLLLLTLSLIGNIFKYKMYQFKKISVLLFHLSFILILIGAGITRYISFEGSLRIREGDSNNKLISDAVFMEFAVDDGNMQYKPRFSNPVYYSELSSPSFERKFDFQEKKIVLEAKKFIPNAIYAPQKVENGTKIIELVRAGNEGRVSEFLEFGKELNIDGLIFSFDSGKKGAINLSEKNGDLFINAAFDVEYMRMSDQFKDTLKSDSTYLFEGRRLFSCNGVNFVFKEFYPNAELTVRTAEQKDAGEDVVIVNVVVNEKQQLVNVFGGKGYVSNPTFVTLDGINIQLNYGSQYIELPFSIFLKDFQLERYPGSMSPASFASEVTLLDTRANISKDYRIFMNNVLDYDGYRFFQSSYDKDELGTILSVNHDFWGTYITYLGYLLMTIGMLMTLFMKNTRFHSLREKIKALRVNKVASILFFIFITGFSYAHNDTSNFEINAKHADYFGTIVVQDEGGRMQPFYTLASEITRKVTGKDNFENHNPMQLVISMLYNPQHWQSVEMIKVTHPALKEELGITGNFASLIHFFDNRMEYKLRNSAEEANRKKPGDRSKYDNEVIEVDERVNVCYMVYSYSFFRFFPIKGDPNNTWTAPNSESSTRTGIDSFWVENFFNLYFEGINYAVKSNNWSRADTMVTLLKNYQIKTSSSEIMPSESKIELEIDYQKQNIFVKTYRHYILFGLLLLVVLFVDIFTSKKKKVIEFTIKGLIILIAFSALYHAYGLIVRWYISGHAPWSNAYESMIYIGFATIVSGFIFVKNSKIALAATAILAALILWVASLNWMNPTITNLVPVLDSYWLMIHVAIITASYGFLGLACILALINLIIMIFKTKNNVSKINATLKELTYVNEMTVTVGLFMLTIGTFLGGVWANESWGRYWGWDPKETWAMASVLVYAFVAHMRLVPGLRGFFVYNLATLWAFSSILMTYFGVNYYLAGLHSYAKGDAVPFPSWASYTIFAFLLISVIAFWRNRKFKE